MNPFSYRRCATLIACFALIESLRPASCCIVEVVNGALGLRVPGFASRWETDARDAVRMASARSFASVSLRTRTAFLSSPRSSKSVPRARAPPSMRTSRAEKAFSGSVASRSVTAVASIPQYDAETNAMRSRSRSTTRRVAADWTRPAEVPCCTLNHSTGLTSQP